MGGKRYLEKQSLQKVYNELKFRSSEDCVLVFLMEMRSNTGVYNS